jgi:hypothetical protein
LICSLRLILAFPPDFKYLFLTRASFLFIYAS